MNLAPSLTSPHVVVAMCEKYMDKSKVTEKGDGG